MQWAVLVQTKDEVPCSERYPRAYGGIPGALFILKGDTMNLRDDAKKTPIDLWKDARTSRNAKNNMHKKAGKATEEANTVLVTTFNDVLNDKLKTTKIAVVCVVKDTTTEIRIRTTMDAKIPNSIGSWISLSWPANILLVTENTIGIFIDAITSYVKDINEKHPGLILKYGDGIVITRLETKTKFFK